MASKKPSADDERLELIKKNVVEIISESELIDLLKKKEKPVVYCGYEPSGPLHLGHFVTIVKLMDFAKAGFKVKVLLADVHAMLNRKGAKEDVKKEVAAWVKTIKAIGLKADVIVGSDFQFDKNYTTDIMEMAQHITINRGLRSMQEVARDIENATISQLWYPLMQVEDIKALDCDVAYGGLEQRKIHMVGRELVDVTNHKFIAIHTPLITSLKGPGSKMSKSVPGSGISVTDTDEEIKKSIDNAYCPPKVVEDNPILQISKLIIFPLIEKLEIVRPERFGGNVIFEDYAGVEKAYVTGELHPMDLKNAVTRELINIISKIRKNF